MKRSDINHHIRAAEALFARLGFRLPPFASWTPQQWRGVGHEADEIRTRALGWDVTDLNSGRFMEVGLTLFTLRNGRLDDPFNRKLYAEKVLMSYEGQVTPMHFHKEKTEDIINRGSGVLVIELFNSDPAGKVTSTPVRVGCDGIVREVRAGGTIELGPGESITLTPGLYHQFHARRGCGACLIGEVSSVNDDTTDNYFRDPLPRYPSIDEDEPPYRLLCTEYLPAEPPRDDRG
jgi:D-lyxose ketol-isomerase